MENAWAQLPLTFCWHWGDLMRLNFNFFWVNLNVWSFNNDPLCTCLFSAHCIKNATEEDKCLFFRQTVVIHHSRMFLCDSPTLCSSPSFHKIYSPSCLFLSGDWWSCICSFLFSAADLKMGHSKFYELDFELSIQTFACLLCSLTTRNLGHPIYQDEIVMTTRNNKDKQEEEEVQLECRSLTHSRFPPSNRRRQLYFLLCISHDASKMFFLFYSLAE